MYSTIKIINTHEACGIAHFYNPSYSGSRIKRLVVQGWLDEKVKKTPISVGIVACTCHLSYVGDIR
jgi:hypothetical protein